MSETPVNERILAHCGTVRHTIQGPAKPRAPVRIRTPPPDFDDDPRDWPEDWFPTGDGSALFVWRGVEHAAPLARSNQCGR
jgi:hypothetical protein